MQKKRKFNTSQPGQQTLAIHISPNMSRNKSKKTMKNKLYKTLDYWSRDTLNFNFSEKGLGLVSLQRFVYDFHE